MCNPAAFMVATMVISAVSTGVSMYQQNQAQKSQMKAAKKESQYIEEAEVVQIEALDAQIEEVTDKGELEKLERARQAMRERAKIMVAASESGALGNSVLQQLSASFVQEGEDKGIIDYNTRADVDQVERQKRATEINSERQKANAFASVQQPISGFMQGLNIGLSGASGAMSGYAMGKGAFPK